MRSAGRTSPTAGCCGPRSTSTPADQLALLAGQVQVDDLPDSARVLEAGPLDPAVAPLVALGGVAVVEAQAGHAGLGERLELVGGRAAIGIEVAPDQQLGEARIGGVDDPVAIVIELVERRESVLGVGAVGQPGAGAEQLVAAVDRAAVVEVD